MQIFLTGYNMPRVLQINTTLNWGSTGRIAEYIGRFAVDSGWECYIAHGSRYVGTSSMETYQVTNRLDEYAHYAKSLLFDRNGLGSKCATRRLVRWIETEVKPDIIHLHCIHGYYLNYQILFEYLNKTHIPIVWTFHDCWAFTGHCAHFVEKECTRWINEGCGDCPLLGSYPKSILDNSSNNYKLKKELFTGTSCHKNIICVSRWLENQVAKSFFSRCSRQVIYNGIDLNAFYPKKSNIKRRLGIENKKMLIGVATSWTKMKGLHDYYRLANILPGDYVIVLIGLSKSLINDLPPNIIGIKRTNSIEELVEFYSAADVVLNLSYAETFGLTTVEGLACGTPSIVYDVTASPELISELTGIVVPLGDINALCKAITELINRNVPPEICRKRAEDLFDINVCINKYLDLYKTLLANT